MLIKDNVYDRRLDASSFQARELQFVFNRFWLVYITNPWNSVIFFSSLLSLKNKSWANLCHSSIYSPYVFARSCHYWKKVLERSSQFNLFCFSVTKFAGFLVCKEFYGGFKVLHEFLSLEPSERLFMSESLLFSENLSTLKYSTFITENRCGSSDKLKSLRTFYRFQVLS